MCLTQSISGGSELPPGWELEMNVSPGYISQYLSHVTEQGKADKPCCETIDLLRQVIILFDAALKSSNFLSCAFAICRLEEIFNVDDNNVNHHYTSLCFQC